MHCKQCGCEFQFGLTHCPNCNCEIHYWGKTKIIAGVEQSALEIIDIFNGTFKKHDLGAGDRMFIAGTPLTTPRPENMLQEWEKPWLYARLLAIGAFFLMLGHFMYNFLQHPGGYFVMSIVGSLLVPLSVVIFYWEINIPRDIPIYKVLLVFFIGGMLSLVFAVILPNFSQAFLAPLTEEPAKIIALAIFVYALDCRYIFGGLLLGAAVGAGFAAFEDIWYVMRYSMMYAAGAAIEIIGKGIDADGLKFLVNLHTSAVAFFQGNEQAGKGFMQFSSALLEQMPQGVGTFFWRAIYTLGGHVTWAAIEGGALVLAKGNETLQLKHFCRKAFLKYVPAVMGLHFLWNFNFGFNALITIAIHFALMALAVLLAFTLIKKAIAQILLTVNSVPLQDTASSSKLTLTAITGILRGSVFEVSMPLTIGRDPNTCNVILPQDTYGVSRRHCIVEPRQDGLYIMDVGSTAGTFLQGQKLAANRWYKVTGNFYLGSEDVTFSAN